MTGDPAARAAARAAAARGYVLAHDADARLWDRQRKAELVTMLNARRAAMGIVSLHGDPATWSKDEVLNELLDLRYPREALAAARALLHRGASVPLLATVTDDAGNLAAEPFPCTAAQAAAAGLPLGWSITTAPA